nr:hypothetical protein Q903MT_gene71 [Picea sitchensis]
MSCWQRMSCFYMFLRYPVCAWPAWVGPEPNSWLTEPRCYSLGRLNEPSS